MTSKIEITYGSEDNESDDFEESLGDESEGENTSEDGDTKDDNEKPGLAVVMAKILRKDKKAILAKTKTEKEIKSAKKRSETKENDEDNDDDDDATKYEQDLKRKKWENMSRVKPTVFDRETEKKLQRVATRGVVQLFNAVQKQQRTVTEKLTAVGSSVRKQDKVLEAVNKGEFLDVLKKSDIKSESISKKTEDKEDEPSWSILKKDFMMGAKMKDWNEESDSEGGEKDMEH